MKVAIIGLGAMGSIYAALFATSGFEVIVDENHETNSSSKRQTHDGTDIDVDIDIEAHYL